MPNTNQYHYHVKVGGRDSLASTVSSAPFGKGGVVSPHVFMVIGRPQSREYNYPYNSDIVAQDAKVKKIQLMRKAGGGTAAPTL